MKLEQEVRHKSEDVDDEVPLDVVRALRRRVRIVSREYDVPYIAGYSEDAGAQGDVTVPRRRCCRKRLRQERH
jgi:hypothetical protein